MNQPWNHPQVLYPHCLRSSNHIISILLDPPYRGPYTGLDSHDKSHDTAARGLRVTWGGGAGVKGGGDRLGGESASGGVGGRVPTAAIPLEPVANAVEEFDSIPVRLALG